MLETEFGKLGKFNINDVLGRTIICDDGVPRRVHSIHYSFQHKDRFIINEPDPDSNMGHWVHALSLSCQIHGNSLPTEEQKKAASRAWNKLLYTEQGNKLKVTPTGLIIPN